LLRIYLNKWIRVRLIPAAQRTAAKCIVIFLPILLATIGCISAANAIDPQDSDKVTRLSLQQAIDLALAPSTAPASLGSAQTALKIAEHGVARARAATSLQADAGIDVRSLRVDLRSLGLSIPSYPLTNPVRYVGANGPYGVLDPRIRAVKTLIDKSAKRNILSAQASLEEAGSSLQEEREKIAAETAREYFDALRTSEQSTLEERNVAMAETTRRYAEERYAQAVASAGEVRQSQINANNARQKLSSVRLEQTRAVLRLLFLVGERLGDTLELSDAFAEHRATITLEDAIAEALHHNPQLATLQIHDKSLMLRDAAVKAQRLPVLSMNGDFGMNIVAPDPSYAGSVSHSITYTATVELRVPVLDGHVRALERADLGAQLQEEHLRERDLRRQIELDTRLAFAALQQASEQLDLAKKTLEAADLDLEETRANHTAEKASGMDLQQAETRRSSAEDGRISALYTQAQARLSLAEVLGNVSSLDW
jgi:outer membrane protein TolC